ncbi:hypothetical protein M441DRAFT_51668 [Trichoderma asperellum CBS 433.97]|uniref:Uncharacterized protein n=1 Tax=Trichoderma asperellum (strain ATCC 204424 / CBS 433.97 / NBRC 101777) TaxID=1042311 RepID=A0A2T3YU06_TRIA4|nr:hypothetical protein M441DRAFT_51668 [Trichoderma asperellum CBS 433.97]PTB35994.1 hypothetical protein M441DRAFT_51668 [Trichoderma asperellum CBS 433.97]
MASGPESLSPPGQGEKKQRGLGSIPHIARTLLAKPGRRLAPVVIFNSGAWASCHVRHASWARSQASSGRHTPSPNCPVPFAGSYEASSSITSHHPSRPLSTAVPAGSPAQFGSALLCPAAPVSSWTLFVIAGRCCVLGTARMPTGPLPGIMPACAPCFASQTSMCRQVKYDTRSKQQTSAKSPPLHVPNRYDSPPENPESHSAWHPLPPPVSRGTWPLRGLLSTGKYLLYPSSPARLSLMGLSHVGGRAKLSLAAALRVEGSKQLAAALQVRRGQAGARHSVAPSLAQQAPQHGTAQHGTARLGEKLAERPVGCRRHYLTFPSPPNTSPLSSLSPGLNTPNLLDSNVRSPTFASHLSSRS